MFPNLLQHQFTSSLQITQSKSLGTARTERTLDLHPFSPTTLFITYTWPDLLAEVVGVPRFRL